MRPTPGSPEWLRYMTASKISAVMGTSPWDSPFSMWHRMAGHLPPVDLTDAMEYGNAMEGAILQWLAGKLDLDLTGPEWITHPHHPRFAATPDALHQDGTCWVPVEAKTARDAWEWGPSGSDGPIPAGYYDQVQWQMFVMGAPYALIGADVAMSLRHYRIEADKERQAELEVVAADFLHSLDMGEAPPIDGATSTYLAVRQLHPEIDDVDAVIPDRLALPWLTARAALAPHAAAELAARSLIADHMGTARRAVWNGVPILYRAAKNGGTPYVTAYRNLPTPKDAA